MKAALMWFLKEWRDHRTVFVGIALAVPVLTALAAWGLVEVRQPSNPAPIAQVFALGTLILFWFGIASELVALDLRRGVMNSLRRTPTGLGSAWGGKVAFLLVSGLALFAWTALCLTVLWQLGGRPEQPHWWWQEKPTGATAGELFSAAGLHTVGASPFWSVALAGLSLCTWPLLVGSWVGRGGAAGLGSLLLLASFGVPAYLWWADNTHVLPLTQQSAAIVLLLVGAAGLGLATLSFLRGHRQLGRPWRPVVVGGTALIVLLGGGVAFGALRVHAWTSLDPQDTDLGVYAAHVGADEQTLWVSVYRGHPYVNGKSWGVIHDAPPPGTPMQTWRVDLETGDVVKVDGGKECVVNLPPYCGLGLPHEPRCLEPSGVLVTYAHRDDSRPLASWWDGRTSKRVARLPADVRNARIDRLLDAALAEMTWQRDREGRRVWLRNNGFQREGEERTYRGGTYSVGEGHPPMHPLPGGWGSLRGVLRDDRQALGFVTAEGTRFKVKGPKMRVPGVHGALSVWHKIERRPDARIRTWAHRVVAFEDGAELPVVNPPDHAATGIVGPYEILVRRGDPTEARLAIWNVQTGQDRPLRWVGQAPKRVNYADVLGWDAEGRALVRLMSGMHLAVLDTTAGQIRLIGERVHVAEAVALLEDGAAVVLEPTRHGKRVVRYGPEPGQREQLFPFEAKGKE